jgi:2-dehydropantoate 2-reductase
MRRYVFIGAGAIGSAVGGLLTRHDVPVLLVARGAHAEAVAGGGLTVRCPDDRFSVRPPTVTGPEQARLGTADVLVLCTKTPQATAALDQWADVPVHDPAGRPVGRAADLLPICTALNGVASEDLALRRFARVFAVCVWCPAVMIEPGEVIVRTAPGRGVFHLGRYGVPDDPDGDARLLAGLARDWGAAGCRVVHPPEVMAWKYRKLLANLGNALQALLDDASDAADLRQAVEDEGRDVLTAAGIRFLAEDQPADWRDGLSIQPVPGEPERLGGSSWQSLVRGTGSIETDYLNGEIALVARRIGHPAPLNSRLTALARRAARDGLPPGSIRLDDLRTHLAAR